MKITINFKYLPQVLCQLGIHAWWDEDYFNHRGQNIYKICMTCGKEKFREIRGVAKKGGK